MGDIGDAIHAMKLALAMAKLVQIAKALKR